MAGRRVRSRQCDELDGNLPMREPDTYANANSDTYGHANSHGNPDAGSDCADGQREEGARPGTSSSQLDWGDLAYHKHLPRWSSDRDGAEHRQICGRAHYSWILHVSGVRSGHQELFERSEGEGPVGNRARQLQPRRRRANGAAFASVRINVRCTHVAGQSDGLVRLTDHRKIQKPKHA